MSGWYTRSIRWEREQAITDRTEVARLLDDDWSAREARKRRAEARSLRYRMENLEEEAAQYEDRGWREREAQRITEQADRWDALAVEHEAYRDRLKDGVLFEASESEGGS